jgi:NADPH2:quinone reductase
MPRAVLCRSLGGLEELSLEDVPSRPLGPGEVRVALHACGVNFPDVLQVAGKYQYKPPLPFTPGVESAGVVSEIGAGVTSRAVGDRVITRQRTGGYAEEIVVPAEHAMPLPEGFDFAEGASFIVGYHTAYHALAQRAMLRPGEVLLVHGAAGGVGLGAVEVGKLLGATVIATASTPEKLEVVRRRGADHVINYTEQSFVEEVRRLTDGRGANVIYDPVGGDVMLQSLRCVAWSGRILVIGFAAGTIPEIPANRILIKGCSVIGVRAGEAGRQDPSLPRASLGALFDYAALGKLRPHVSHRVPIERFKEAMRLLRDRKAIGRVVITAHE